jgi:hypothetical protein
LLKHACEQGRRSWRPARKSSLAAVACANAALRSPPAPTRGAAPQTAATLHEQTQQLNKIVDDLNEIEFTMKKATKVIADITKGIMTDK